MIEVTGKDGRVHSFADGTPDAQIDAALEAMYGAPPPYAYVPPHSQHQQSGAPLARPFPIVPVLGGALAVAVIALVATLASNMAGKKPEPAVAQAPTTDAAIVLPAGDVPPTTAIPAGPAVTPETFAGFVATAQGGNVTVRTAAAASSAQLAQLPHGAPISVTGSVTMPDGLWRQVSIGGATGYVKGQYVSQTQPAAIAKAPPAPAVKMIPRDFWGFATTAKAEGNVNVRSSPSTSASVTSSIPTGASVYVVGEQSDWYLVEWSGKRGWANRNYVSREYVGD